MKTMTKTAQAASTSSGARVEGADTSSPQRLRALADRPERPRRRSRQRAESLASGQLGSHLFARPLSRLQDFSKHLTANGGTGRGGMVVGVDGTQESAAALRWAARHIDRFGPLLPATAWRYPPWAGTTPWLERAASMVRRSGLSLGGDYLVAQGAAGPTLVENSANADLLVVGSRGRGRAAGSLLGTVSGYCIARAAVPVAVVPLARPVVDHRRVIVGVDDSPEALAAIRWAVRHAPQDHHVHLVHVASVRGDSAELLGRLVRDARAQVEPGRRVAITGRVAYGSPAATLRLAAAEADMLVLGRRGREGIAHAVIGSVTTALCRDPGVVTVVVPAAVR